jgi:hypothetical protein
MYQSNGTPQQADAKPDRLTEALGNEIAELGEAPMWLERISQDARLDPWSGAQLLLRLSKINTAVAGLINFAHKALGEAEAEAKFLAANPNCRAARERSAQSSKPTQRPPSTLDGRQDSNGEAARGR